MLTIREKTQAFIANKVYVITAAVITCFLLSCLLFFVFSSAHPAVVFLRTTFPAEMTLAEEKADTVTPETITPLPAVETNEENVEDQLVAMLMEENQTEYDKLENKERWHVVRMRVTGYCACSKCCGRFSDGTTASTHEIRWGDHFVAADKRYRFGTEMIIPGYNGEHPVKVLDRGKAIKGNRLDLYFDTHRQAQKWGVKYMDVMVKTSK